MMLDISFREKDMNVGVIFNEINQSIKVNFGEIQIVNAVSVKIEDEVAYINY